MLASATTSAFSHLVSVESECEAHKFQKRRLLYHKKRIRFRNLNLIRFLHTIETLIQSQNQISQEFLCIASS